LFYSVKYKIIHQITDSFIVTIAFFELFATYTYDHFFENKIKYNKY